MTRGAVVVFITISERAPLSAGLLSLSLAARPGAPAAAKGKPRKRNNNTTARRKGEIALQEETQRTNTKRSFRCFCNLISFFLFFYYSSQPTVPLWCREREKLDRRKKREKKSGKKRKLKQFMKNQYKNGKGNSITVHSIMYISAQWMSGQIKTDPRVRMLYGVLFNFCWQKINYHSQIYSVGVLFSIRICNIKLIQ